MLDNHTTVGVDLQDDRGPWITVASGNRFYFLDPKPHEVDLQDIISALSKTCRFNGHCNQFYSVAEHSVIVSYVAEDFGYSKELQTIGLLHDATEAYVGDMVRPLKSLIKTYRDIEDDTWRAIAAHFGLPDQIPQEIKEIDDIVLMTEKRYLLPNAPEWPNMPKALDNILIGPLFSEEAQNQFYERAIELGLM